MIFSALGTIDFTILWIYMLAVARCYKDDYWIFFTKAFAIFGVVSCLFVLFHSCFERRVTIGRGIFGCIIFFVITVVAFLNLLNAFMAMNCICKCSSGANAFSAHSSEDVTIFFMCLAGAFMLVGVLLISSVAHEGQHRRDQQNRGGQS